MKNSNDKVTDFTIGVAKTLLGSIELAPPDYMMVFSFTFP